MRLLPTVFFTCAAVAAAVPTHAPQVELAGATDADVASGVLVLYTPVAADSEEFKPERYWSGFGSEDGGIVSAGESDTGDGGIAHAKRDPAFGKFKGRPFTGGVKRSPAPGKFKGHLFTGGVKRDEGPIRHLWFDKDTGMIKAAAEGHGGKGKN